VLVTLTLAVMAKFYGHELVLGQMNLLFGVVATAGALAAINGHEAAAGALTALAIVVKPYAVIFLPGSSRADASPQLPSRFSAVRSSSHCRPSGTVSTERFSFMKSGGGR
jgi:hypothetical protein